MTVQELIDELKKCDPKAPVITTKYRDSGCSTCGGDYEDTDLTAVNDLETRVVLDFY